MLPSASTMLTLLPWLIVMLWDAALAAGVSPFICISPAESLMQGCNSDTGRCVNSSCTVFGFYNFSSINCQRNNNNCVNSVCIATVDSCELAASRGLKTHCYGHVRCTGGVTECFGEGCPCLYDGDSLNFKVCQVPTASGSPSPSPAPSASESPSPSPAPSASESPSPSPAPSESESPSPSPSQSTLARRSPVSAPSESESPSPSPSPSESESPSPSPSPSESESPSPSPSEPPSPLDEMVVLLHHLYGHTNVGAADSISSMDAVHRLQLAKAITATQVYFTDTMAVAYINVTANLSDLSVDIPMPGMNTSITILIDDWVDTVSTAVITVLRPTYESFAAAGLIPPPVDPNVEEVTMVLFADRMDSEGNIIHDVPFTFLVDCIGIYKQQKFFSHHCEDTCHGISPEPIDANMTLMNETCVITLPHASPISIVSQYSLLPGYYYEFYFNGMLLLVSISMGRMSGLWVESEVAFSITRISGDKLRFETTHWSLFVTVSPDGKEISWNPSPEVTIRLQWYAPPPVTPSPQPSQSPSTSRSAPPSLSPKPSQSPPRSPRRSPSPASPSPPACPQWTCIPQLSNTGVLIYTPVNRPDEVQCMSADGRNCLWVLTTTECQGLFPYADSPALKPLKCGAMFYSIYSVTGYDVVGHWCYYGLQLFPVASTARHCVSRSPSRSRNPSRSPSRSPIASPSPRPSPIPSPSPGSKWVCVQQSTRFTPVSRPVHDEVQCMATDGRNCLWAVSMTECQAFIFNAGSMVLNPLKCGAMAYAIYGTVGYDTPGHWCNTGLQLFPSELQPGWSNNWRVFLTISDTSISGGWMYEPRPPFWGTISGRSLTMTFPNDRTYNANFSVDGKTITFDSGVIWKWCPPPTSWWKPVTYTPLEQGLIDMFMGAAEASICVSKAIGNVYTQGNNIGYPGCGMAAHCCGQAPVPTNSPSPKPSPSPTRSASPSARPSVSRSPKASPSQASTSRSPRPSPSPLPSPSPSPLPSSSLSPVSSPSPSLSPVSSPSPSLSPVSSPSPSPSPRPSPSPLPSSIPSPDSSPWFNATGREAPTRRERRLSQPVDHPNVPSFTIVYIAVGSLLAVGYWQLIKKKKTSPHPVRDESL